MKTMEYDDRDDTMIAPNGQRVTWHRDMTLENFQALQIAAYVMTGGGFLGKLYAEQPGYAYLDSRVGRLPYSKTEIENVRQVLVAACHALGFDPNNAPAMPHLPASWVW